VNIIPTPIARAIAEVNNNGLLGLLLKNNIFVRIKKSARSSVKIDSKNQIVRNKSGLVNRF